MSSPWTGLIGDVVGLKSGCMRLTVTCEYCEHRHVLEQLKQRGQTVFLICHECEEALVAEWPR